MSTPTGPAVKNTRSTVPFRVAVLLARYTVVRAETDRLCETLEHDDYQLQSMPEASPVKWHLAHTTWFFEHFLLSAHDPDYRPFHAVYAKLFNSYYDSVGSRVARPERGLLSRPTVPEIKLYRRRVDEAVNRWLTERGDNLPAAATEILELGLNHEQQHQELILTDLKHAFSRNPLAPVYALGSKAKWSDATTAPMRWVDFGGGLLDMGHIGHGFGFDNESPRHKAYLRPYQLGSRLVTASEFIGFINAGGYDKSEYWLSDGWAVRDLQDWKCPEYWSNDEAGKWNAFTLGGQRPLTPSEPVTHVSFYEADAYSRWAGVRLPTEYEWEIGSVGLHPTDGHYADAGVFHPQPAERQPGDKGLAQMYGDCWEWTSSPYTAYPGYRHPVGPLGEYNGKFMCNQMVLRGGSCASPRGHLRPTYRNFFPPSSRWQFSGIRLARDV